MRQQFTANTAGTFKTYIYENNRKVVPVSAALTVSMPGSKSLLIDGAAMTVAVDGLISYALSASDSRDPAVGYMAEIAYLYNSEACRITVFYDVVRMRLAKVITDEDIASELPQLKEGGLTARGQAEGGSTTTIVDTELKRYDDGYFTGGLAYSIDKDESRQITAFSSSTGTVTAMPFSSAISTDRYVLTRSFTREIDRAFEKIEEMLIRRGRRPELILDPYDLREVHIYLSVAEVCKGLVSGSSGIWLDMWKDYEKRAELAFGGINFKYDISNDGVIAGAEDGVRLDIIRAVRG